MNVDCISNDPRRLVDHQRTSATQFETPYPLTPGRSYSVVGMALVRNVLRLLVEDDDGSPCFAPAGFFAQEVSAIPADWLFALRPGIRTPSTEWWSEPQVAVWGYAELVEDPDHAGLLEEVEPLAVQTFRERLAESSQS